MNTTSPRMAHHATTRFPARRSQVQALACSRRCGLRRPTAGSLITVASVMLVTCLGSAAATTGGATPNRMLKETNLLLARSVDGRTFEDQHMLFAPQAASPDLARLDERTILALFDVAPEQDDGQGTSILAASVSKDNGTTWSPAVPVRFDDRTIMTLDPRHADLVRLPDGSLRLFFTTTVAKKRKRGATSVSVIRTATTRDGLNYRVDGRTRVYPAHRADVYPVAAVIHQVLHVYVHEPKSGSQGDNGSVTRHFVSRDGYNFMKLESLDVGPMVFTGSIVRHADQYRAYVSCGSLIRSLASPDGRTWHRCTDLTGPKGWDPAVLQLKDGTHLMLYCAQAERLAATRSALVDVSLDAQGPALAGPGSTDDDNHPVPGGDETSGADESSAVDATSGLEDWDPTESDGFVPLPNFTTRIDYVAWFTDYVLGEAGDNAFEAYCSFMPLTPGDNEGKPEWPEFDNMFTSAEPIALPGPWDPAMHPDWAASNEAAQEVLERFRQANLHQDYAMTKRAVLGGSPPDEQRLLIEIRLPHLPPHRMTSKATLADAWKAEEGKVSVPRMLRAWETNLRAAAHMAHGATLIEDLVGIAENNLTLETARCALAQGMFSPDELEDAFDILRSYEYPDLDPSFILRGEHAMSLDLIQWLYLPEGGGVPTFRGRQAASRVFDPSDSPWVEQLETLSPNDVHEGMEAFDRFYRDLADMARIGYPTVRRADIDAAADECVGRSMLTSIFLPRLGRVYQMRASNRAAARATQLAYATHMFKARHGRWPASLDELPAAYDSQMRIDPFTGRDFGYELTDDGPRIYSASENGRDDGGVHTADWGRGSSGETDSDDYVFWPPQPRPSP